MLFQNINSLVMSIGRITPTGVNLLGTTFLINKPGYCVTAAHIIKNDDKGLVIIPNKVNNFFEYQDTTDNSVQYIPVSVVNVNPFTDICILKLKSDAVSNIKISGTDNILPGENVSVFGYPHSDHGRMVLTQQNTAVGAKILIDSNGIKTKHIVLNIQSRPGQSGSPIINNKLEVIGILIGSYAPNSTGGISLGGIDPQTLHQTTHAISSEYIKEMI